MGDNEPRTLSPGEFLDNNFILKPLGQGKMCEVHLAFDIQRLDLVAIKRLHPHHERVETFRKRLKREGEILRQFHHPHLVGFVDSHVDETPCYLVAEYLRGQPLDQRIRGEGGSLFVAEAFRYLGELASGLHYAHSKKIIHRDMRPDNVMIDHGGTSRIFDFGIAFADDKLVQTTIGEIGLMGEYASPEQMLGRTLTHRSDLYSLGAVIYFAATGRKVIEAKSVEEILGQINAPVRPPSHLEEDIPPVFDTILCKLLAKNPEQRYDSAKSLLIDIGKLYATQDEGVRKALFGKVEDANLAWARRAYVQREYDKVHQLAQGCESLPGPKKAALYRLEALAFRAEKNSPQAIAAFQKAAATQENDINYTLDYVLELVRQNQIPQAQQALNREFRAVADQAVVSGLQNLLANWGNPAMAAKRDAAASEAAKGGQGQGGAGGGGLLGRLGSFFRGGK